MPSRLTLEELFSGSRIGTPVRSQGVAERPFIPAASQFRAASSDALAFEPATSFNADRASLESLAPADQEEESGNFLLNVLMLPEIALFDRSVRGLTFALLRDEGIGGMVERFAKGSPFAHLSDYIFGTDFAENITGEDVLRAAGIEEPGFLPTLALEIGLGPSTYTGIGAFTKLGKAAKAGRVFRRLAGEVPDVLSFHGKEVAEGVFQLEKGAGLRRAQQLADKGILERVDPALYSLKEQAQRGFRRGLTIAGIDVAPKWFNVPLLSGVETITQGILRSGVGQAVRAPFTNLPLVGRSLENAGPLGLIFNPPRPGDIEATKLLQRQITDMAHGMTGAMAVMREVGGLFESVSELQGDKFRRAMSTLDELGVVGVDDELTLDRVDVAFRHRLGEFVGDDVAQELVALSKPGISRVAATELAQRGAEESIGRAGFEVSMDRAVTDALDQFRRFDKKFGPELLTTYRKALRAADDLEGTLRKANIPQAREVSVNLSEIDGDWGADFSRLIRPDGSIVELDVRMLDTIMDGENYKHLIREGWIDKNSLPALRDWTRMALDEVGIDELNPFGNTLRGLNNLPEAMRAVLQHGPGGVGEVNTVVANLLRKRFDLMDTIAEAGNSVVGDSTRATLRKSMEKVALLVAKNPRAAGIGNEMLSNFLVGLGKLPEKATEADLMNSLLYIADTNMARLRQSEIAAGVYSGMTEFYFMHTTTGDGKKFMNELSQRAFADSPLARATFERQRQITNRTVAEVNAMLQQKGVDATGGVRFDVFNKLSDLTERVRGAFDKADPEWLDKLRKLDPDAAQFFEADLATGFQKRLQASAIRMGSLPMRDALLATAKQGGIAAKVLKGMETDDVEREVLRFFSRNGQLNQELLRSYAVVPVNDLFAGDSAAWDDVFSQGFLQAARGSLDEVVPEGSIAADALTAREKAANWVREIEVALDIPVQRGFAQKGVDYAIVPRQMLTELAGAHRKMTEPKEVLKLVRWLHKATNLWKGWTNLPNPAFHARNFASTGAMAFLAGVEGVSGLRSYQSAFAIQKAMLGRGQTLADVVLTNVNGETLDAATFLQKTKQLGGIDVDFGALDMFGRAVDMFGEVSEKKMPRWLRWGQAQTNPLLAPIRDGVGRASENLWRMTTIIDQWKKGATLEDSVRHAKKFLIDYDSHLLTHTERVGFRAAFPFYTFMRRAIPLAMDHILQSPQKTTFFGKALRAWSETPGLFEAESGDIDELPKDLVPDYIGDMYGIPIRKNDEGNPEYFLLRGWLPQSDLAELAHGFRELMNAKEGRRGALVDSIAARLSPLIKQPVEFMKNFSAFTGKPIERFEGQQYEMFGMSFSPFTVQLMRDVSLLNNLDRLNPLGVERTGEQGERNEIGALQRYAQFFLGLRSYEGRPVEEAQKSVFEYEQENKRLKGEYNRLLRNLKDPSRQEQIDSLREQMRNNTRKIIETHRAKQSFQRMNRENGG